MNRGARSVALAFQGIRLVYGWIHLAAQIVVAAVTDDPHDLVVAVARVVEASRRPTGFSFGRYVLANTSSTTTASAPGCMSLRSIARPEMIGIPIVSKKPSATLFRFARCVSSQGRPGKFMRPLLPFPDSSRVATRLTRATPGSLGQFVANAKDIRSDALSRVSRAGGIHGRCTRDSHERIQARWI